MSGPAARIGFPSDCPRQSRRPVEGCEAPILLRDSGTRWSENVCCWEVKMVVVRRRKEAPPPATQAPPSFTDEGPHLRARDGGRDVSHSKVSRQRGTACMKRTRRKRIDLSLQYARSETTDDEEPRPTKPLGGKLPGNPLVQADEHSCQNRGQNPPSR